VSDESTSPSLASSLEKSPHLNPTEQAPTESFKVQSFFQRNWVRHGLLSTSLLVLAIAAGNILNFQAGRVAQGWTDGLKYAESSQVSSVNDKENLKVYLDAFTTSTLAERDRVQVQLRQIERRARAYARITIFFYTRLFAAIALASATGIISAVCLFYISKVGWDRANNYIINIFVVSSAITVFVGAFPVIFQQEANVKKNSQLYMSYLDLENQILTALATQKNAQGEPITLGSILVSSDQKMAELNIESIGFDANAIPRNAAIFEQLGQGE